MKNRYAILVIDMLNDFINGKLRLEGVEDIVQNIQKLLSSARHFIKDEVRTAL
jgi:nicotinamidase-related amidase